MVRSAPSLFLELAAQHPGEVIEIDLGVTSVLLVTDPEQVQHVLVDHWRNYSKDSPMWDVVKRLLGTGLVTADGDTWFRNRRLIQPLFSTAQLAAMTELMIAAAVEEFDPLVQKIDGAPIDMEHQMIRATQRVILATLFGTALPQQKLDELGQAVVDAFAAMNFRMMLYFMPDWLLPGRRKFQHSLTTLDRAIAELIAERRAHPSDQSDLLSLLLAVRDEDGSRMSDAQLRDELVTMFVAGNETTAITMSWLMYVLDQHPEVDARVRAELDTVIGDRRATVADIQALDYSRRVIQETMRVYPPSWIIPRQALQADDLCGYAIPAGTNLVVSQYVLHHDRKHWDSPETFDPDRFLPERAAGRHRHAYMPFGHGPRQCIGNHFAMLEALVLLAVLRRRVSAKLVPGHVVVPAAATTLRPKQGLRMTLHAA
jgi:cytochrome P450